MSSSSSEKYLVLVAGGSDVNALTTTIGAAVTRGTATFKRIVWPCVTCVTPCDIQ